MKQVAAFECGARRTDKEIAIVLGPRDTAVVITRSVLCGISLPGGSGAPSA
jgi:hypothetical protein